MMYVLFVGQAAIHVLILTNMKTLARDQLRPHRRPQNSSAATFTIQYRIIDTIRFPLLMSGLLSSM